MNSPDVGALVDYANELELDAVGSGLVWLKARRAEALAKINGGGSSDIISTTVDGQTFTRQISATATDLFSAYTLAIKRFNGDDVKIVYPLFQGIPL